MQLAVLGLGNMGSALAHCLLKAGHDVSVWNRTSKKAEDFAEAGATICASPDDAVAVRADGADGDAGDSRVSGIRAGWARR